MAIDHTVAQDPGSAETTRTITINIPNRETVTAAKVAAPSAQSGSFIGRHDPKIRHVRVNFPLQQAERIDKVYGVRPNHFVGTFTRRCQRIGADETVEGGRIIPRDSSTGRAQRPVLDPRKAGRLPLPARQLWLPHMVRTNASLRPHLPRPGVREWTPDRRQRVR
jgi:hypothetical protein